jgi:bifunctional non-homologous end joining protein LigD
MLAKLIRSPSSVLRSQPLPGSVAQIESSIKLFGLEGIVAKKNASRYRAGPTQDWQKIRFSPRQEFVIGGYRLRSERLDCLLVGYYRDGLFCCAGHIREGFTTRNRATLLGLLRGKTASVACPFVDLPHHHPGRGQPHPWDDRLFDLTPYRWCPPTVVVECSYLGWSRHELLRQGRYLGLRIDKAAHAVMRE